MEREEILTKLTEIFQTVFNDSTLEINEDMTTDDFENWDSIIQMMIVACIEKDFNIKFKLREVGTINSVRGYIDVILSKCEEA